MDFILQAVENEGLGEYKADERITEFLSRVIAEVHDNAFKGNGKFTKSLKDSIEDIKKRTFNSINEMRKMFGKEVLKADERGGRKSMSLFQAFKETIKNNAKSYTKNENFLRDEMIRKTKDSIKKIR